MTTYAERFVSAISDALPGSFTVHDSQGLIVASHGEKGAAMSGFMPAYVDKRKPVNPEDVSVWLTGARMRVRRYLPLYTDEARAAAEAMLADLDNEEG